MQDFSHYSRLHDVQLLISQYLDGMLSKNEEKAFFQLLQSKPEFQEAFERMQKTHQLLASRFEPLQPTAQSEQKAPKKRKKADTTNKNASSQNVSSVWAQIEQQLKADAQAETQPIPFETLSAYYDGEIPATDPDHSLVESQLYANEEASNTLASVHQVSETIRRHGYRLEEGCTVNVTAAVMQAFQAEQNPQTGFMQPEETQEEGISEEKEVVPSPQVIALSAYLDQELSQRETIETNRLIEQDPALKRAFLQFSQIAQGVQSIGEQQQAQATIDCWPAISEILAQEAQPAKVIPLTERLQKRLPILLKVGGPIAAVGLFFALSVQSLTTQTVPLDSTDSVPTSVRLTSSPSTQKLLDTTHNLSFLAPVLRLGTSERVLTMSVAGLNKQQLASADHQAEIASAHARTDSEIASAGSIQPVRYVSNATYRRATPLVLAHHRSSAQASERALAMERPVAVAPAYARTPSLAEKAPSSEEYLFKALNEQMPGEDMSAFLGN